VVLRWGPCLTTTGHIPTDNDRLMTAIAGTAGMRWDSAAVSASRPAVGAADLRNVAR
jgi:hypothetical protein